MGIWTGSALAVALATAAPSESAEVLSLQWTAPPECPQRDDVASRVETLLGRPLSDGTTAADPEPEPKPEPEPEPKPTSAVRTARATVIRHDDGRWVLHILVVSAPDTTPAKRELVHTGRCTTMADAAATMVAIALDPRVLGNEDPAGVGATGLGTASLVGEGAGGNSQGRSGTSRGPGSGAATGSLGTPAGNDTTGATNGEPQEPSIDDANDRQRRPRRRERMRARRPRRGTQANAADRDTPRSKPRARPRGTVSVLGGLGWGAVPRATGVLGGRLGLLMRRARVEASGVYWWPTTLRLVDASDAGANFRLWHIGISAGPRFVLGSQVDVALLVGVEVGQLRGEPVGLVTPQTQTDPWVAIPIGGDVGYAPLPWLAVRAALEGSVPLRRPRFVAEGYGLLHRPSALALRGLLGVEFRFP
ncbi:MAG: hypothetical protein AAGF11_44175 [Myxococcota bacterium]